MARFMAGRLRPVVPGKPPLSRYPRGTGKPLRTNNLDGNPSNLVPHPNGTGKPLKTLDLQRQEGRKTLISQNFFHGLIRAKISVKISQRSGSRKAREKTGRQDPFFDSLICCTAWQEFYLRNIILFPSLVVAPEGLWRLRCRIRLPDHARLRRGRALRMRRLNPF